MQVKELKALKHLTYEEMSEKTGLSQSYIYVRRNKEVGDLTFNDAVKIAKYLNLTLEQLFDLVSTSYEQLMLDAINKKSNSR